MSNLDLDDDDNVDVTLNTTKPAAKPTQKPKVEKKSSGKPKEKKTSVEPKPEKVKEPQIDIEALKKTIFDGLIAHVDDTLNEMVQLAMKENFEKHQQAIEFPKNAIGIAVGQWLHIRKRAMNLANSSEHEVWVELDAWHRKTFPELHKEDEEVK